MMPRVAFMSLILEIGTLAFSAACQFREPFGLLAPQQNVESKLQEVLQGLDGAVRLGPKQSALVAIEQKRGKFLRLVRFCEIPSVDCLLQDAGNSRLPVGEGLLQ